MTRLTESAIEDLTIEQLEAKGYTYLHGATIAPDGVAPERDSYEDVLLLGRVEAAIARLNPAIPATARLDALRQIQRLNAPELIANNETFHRLLTEGIPVTYQKDGSPRGDLVWLLDFDQHKNNEYLVVNQFTIIENDVNKRPDVLLFINGLPLVVIELKNAADENATIRTAFKQLQTYKATIPSLFTYNSLLVISDGLEAQAGSLSAGLSRFSAWKTADGVIEASPLVPQMETLIRGLLNPGTLLDLIRHFTVFDKSERLVPSSRLNQSKGIVTIETTKKIAAYHQYYAVNKAVESTLRAVDLRLDQSSRLVQSRTIKEDPIAYDLPSAQSQPKGDRKAGVVWHTQGSGKSLSMLFYTGKIVLLLNNPTIVVITDRNDLDDQLFDTFAASKQLLRQVPVQAESRDHLKSLLKVASEDFRIFVEEKVPAKRRQFNWHHPQFDPDGTYPVDCYVNGMAEPLLVFALPNDNKTRDVTITLLQFNRWGQAFRSMSIFENQEEINRKVLARISDAGDKQYSNLAGNRERIARYLQGVL